MLTYPTCGIADLVCEDPLERMDKLNAPAILVWLAALGCEPRLGPDGRLVLDEAAREALSPGAAELLRHSWRRISSSFRRTSGKLPAFELPEVEAVFAMAGIMDLRLRVKALEAEHFAEVKQRAQAANS